MDGHYTNAKKQTLIVELFRLIIILDSLCICFRAFIELQNGIKS